MAGRRMPFKANSETALPMEMPSKRAFALAALKTAGSISKVVRIQAP